MCDNTARKAVSDKRIPRSAFIAGRNRREETPASSHFTKTSPNKLVVSMPTSHRSPPVTWGIMTADSPKPTRATATSRSAILSRRRRRDRTRVNPSSASSGLIVNSTQPGTVLAILLGTVSPICDRPSSCPARHGTTRHVCSHKLIEHLRRVKLAHTAAARKGMCGMNTEESVDSESLCVRSRPWERQ